MDVLAYISSALADDIKELSADIDQSPAQVDQSLAALRHDLKLAVRSSVGLTITIGFQDRPVTLTSLDHFTVTADIATSLKLPLPPPTAVEGGSITFYACVPGAFVDLAADLAHSLDLPDDVIILDDDLTPESIESGMTGVSESRTINQAIGLLLERGYSPPAAWAELHENARLKGRDLHQGAIHLLASLAGK